MTRTLFAFLWAKVRFIKSPCTQESSETGFFYWHIHPNKNHEEVLQHGLMKGEGHAFSSQENWVIFSALLLMCFTVPGK